MFKGLTATNFTGTATKVATIAAVISKTMATLILNAILPLFAESLLCLTFAPTTSFCSISIYFVSNKMRNTKNMIPNTPNTTQNESPAPGEPSHSPALPTPIEPSTTNAATTTPSTNQLLSDETSPYGNFHARKNLYKPPNIRKIAIANSTTQIAVNPPSTLIVNALTKPFADTS